MRTFEFILALVLVLRVSLHGRLPRWFKFLPVPFALLQVFVEGYRWQMLPLYFLTITFGILSLRNLDPWKGHPPRWAPIAGLALSIPALVIGIALPSLLPIPMPYPPTGPYPIGTATIYLVDDSRTDPYAPDPHTARELLVQVWYPAASIDSAEKAPWMENAELVAPAVAAWVELPGFAFDHLVYAHGDSYTDAPLLESPESFPVILFSHGYGGFRAQNTFQMQELASHGYVVAAVEHTYASVLTVFPDGRVAPHNPDTLPDGLTDEAYERAAEALVAQWSGDLGFVLSRLNEEDGFLHGRLDLSRVGVMGHSTGGGAAVQFCGTDERCAAGFAMDAWMLPVTSMVIESGVDAPFFFLFSESWAHGSNPEQMRSMVYDADGYAQAYSIDGSRHYDFSDLPAVSPLAFYFNLKGPIDGERVQGMINALTVAFFDRILRGAAAPLLDDPMKSYPELQPLLP